MQKIGLDKCKNKNIKYFSKISQSHTLDICEDNLLKISSVIVNSQVEQYEFMENINKIKVLIKVNLQMIYHSITNELLLKDKCTYILRYIPIPKIIEGNLTYQSFIQKKINVEVFVENISSEVLRSDKVAISYYILLNVSINPSLSIMYNVNNGLFDNIFLSFHNGKNFTQRTFTHDIEYKKFKFKPYSDILVVLGYKKNKSILYVFDVSKKSNKELSSISIDGEIGDFTFINNKMITFDLTNMDSSYLYTLNISNHEIVKIDILDDNGLYKKPCFDKNNKHLYFLHYIDNTSSLCSLVKDKLNTIFSYVDICDYIFSQNSSEVLLKILKDKNDKLFLFNIENSYLHPINIDCESIIKFNFFTWDKNCKNIIILYKENGVKKLISYDINTDKVKKIYENYDIVDFSIDYSTKDLFICIKNNSYKVIKFNNGIGEIILSLPNIIKHIACKM